MTSPVLQLPDFNKTFVVETGACYSGLGAVLMQDKYPLAYISKAFGPENLGLSVYDKEMLAIILAVEKWRPYLIHNQLIIRIDQHSLKYLLEQKISTPLQHKYMTKLLGYNYSIEYKKRGRNRAADALSRRDLMDISCNALNVLKPLWVGEIQTSYEDDSIAQEAITECTLFPYNLSFFSYSDGLLRFKGRLYIGSNTDLRSKIINFTHSSNTGGHSGIQVTLQRLKSTFHWPGIKEFTINIIS